MSDPTLRLPIESSFNAKGTDAAEAAQRRLLALQQQMQQRAVSKSGGDAGAAQAAVAQQRLATETQRTALASNQAAVAAQRLSTEEQRTAAAVQNTATAQSRAEMAALRLAKAQDTAATSSSRGATFAQQLGQAYTSSLMSIVGPAAIATASIKAVGEAGELIQLGTQADAARGSFDNLAVSVHTTGDALLSGLRKAAAGTVSDANLIQSANSGILLTGGKLATELPRLLEIARASAQATGDDVGFVFDSLVKGIARGSPQIIDNAKITLDAEGAFKTYAASIGKTTDQLTRADQQQATLNAVLNAGVDIIAKTGGATETQATKLERLGANWDNVKAKVGSFLGEAVAPYVEGLNAMVNATEKIGNATAAAEKHLTDQGASALAAAKNYDDYATAIERVNEAEAAKRHSSMQPPPNQTPALTEDEYAYAQSLMATGVAADEAAARARNMATDVTAAAVASASAAVASAAHGSGMQYEIQASIDAGLAAQAQAQATADAATQSLIDADAKATQASQTELAALQAQAAADAFIALHPNISASSAASVAAASGMSPLIARLIEATLRANEARQALALFNALAGIKSSGGAMASAKASDLSDIHALKADAAAAPYRAQQAAARDAAEASRHLQSVQGNEIPTIQHLRNEAAALAKTQGVGSADYINKLAEIDQAEKRQAANEKRSAGGGGRGGGGGGARETAAQKTGDRISEIERTSGNKLADIERGTQEKLAAIDQKYAEQRARALQALNDQIAEQSASVKFDQTIDNFDAFQKDMTDAQRAAFAQREAAEVRYNERIAAAQEEAKHEAETGDADFARERLKIREDQAKRQMEIEQRAAQANVDTNGKQQAAVAATAAAATKANEDEANTQIAIAQAKAAEKAGAEQAEKDAVIAAAQEQKDKVVGAAQEQASKVKGASDSQKATVIGNLRAQADAAASWASDIESSARRAQTAMGGVSGPATGGGGSSDEGDTGGDSGGVPATGGGQTAGGQGFGRATGGGGGSSSVGDAIKTLNDATAIINMLRPFVSANAGVLKTLNQYKAIVTSAVGSLLAIQDLRERLVMPSPVLDPVVLAKLKADTELVLNMMISIDASAIKKIGVFGKYLTTEKEAIEILTQMQDLRDKLATPTPPINADYVQALMRDSQTVLNLLLGSFIPLKQRQVDDLKLYADAEGASVNILNGVVDLRKKLSEGAGSAFDLNLLRGLAARAADITRMVQVELVPMSEDQAAGFKRYADVAAAAVAILTNLADLRKRLSEDTGTAFDMNLIKGLAMRAAQILQIVRAQLIPTTEEQADALQHYADAEGNAVEILSGVADLRKQLSEATGGAFDMKLIQALAEEARRIDQIVSAVLVPTSADAADGLSSYADAVGSSVDIVRGVAGLRKDVADLAAPIPEAAIRALAAEAKRIDQIVASVLVPTSEDQASGLDRYGQAVGAAVDIVRGVASLRKDAADIAAPIPEAAIRAIAAEAKRITQIVVAEMIPESEDQADAAKRFADTEGAAVAAIKNVLDLPAKLFVDYVSPSDAQINRVVADTNRIIAGVDRAARAYDTKGLEAAKAFGEATGAILSSFKDQLLFAEAIGSGDFSLDPKKLATFEQGMGQTIAVAGRLGKQAAAIPPADITALQNVTAAMTAAYESQIRLAAVPQMPQMGGGAMGGSSGSGSTIINIHNPPANMDVPGVTRQIRQGLAQQLTGRR